MRGYAALALSFLILCAPGATAGATVTVPTWLGWEEGSKTPRTYQAAGITFATSTKDEEAVTPILTVSAKGHGSIEVRGATGMSFAAASFLVFPANGRAASKPEDALILFRSYTGGAHCCEFYQLVRPTPGGWQVNELGEWDGKGPEPVDIDGDGRLELLATDQRFDYRLASHAGSLMPPVIYELRNGRLVDISMDPRFVPFFRSKLKKFRGYCEEGQESLGACLGYVATAARAGDATTSLAVLDKHPDHSVAGPWSVPLHCGATAGALACAQEKPTKEFDNRHDAVVWFLTDIGYLSGRLQ